MSMNDAAHQKAETVAPMWRIAEALSQHATVTTNTARAWRALATATRDARAYTDVPPRLVDAARDALGGFQVQMEQLAETVREALRSVGIDPDPDAGKKGE